MGARGRARELRRARARLGQANQSRPGTRAATAVARQTERVVLLFRNAFATSWGTHDATIALRSVLHSPAVQDENPRRSSTSRTARPIARWQEEENAVLTTAPWMGPVPRCIREHLGKPRCLTGDHWLGKPPVNDKGPHVLRRGALTAEIVAADHVPAHGRDRHPRPHEQVVDERTPEGPPRKNGYDSMARSPLEARGPASDLHPAASGPARDVGVDLAAGAKRTCGKTKEARPASERLLSTARSHDAAEPPPEARGLENAYGGRGAVALEADIQTDSTGLTIFVHTDSLGIATWPSIFAANP